MTQKTKISRDLLVISFLTLITILTWIGMDIYRRLTEIEIPEILEEQLKPLDPVIKTSLFDILEGRLEEIPSPSPTQAVVEESSPSSPPAGGQAETSD